MPPKSVVRRTADRKKHFNALGIYFLKAFFSFGQISISIGKHRVGDVEDLFRQRIFMAVWTFPAGRQNTHQRCAGELVADKIIGFLDLHTCVSTLFTYHASTPFFFAPAIPCR